MGNSCCKPTEEHKPENKPSPKPAIVGNPLEPTQSPTSVMNSAIPALVSSPENSPLSAINIDLPINPNTHLDDADSKKNHISATNTSTTFSNSLSSSPKCTPPTVLADSPLSFFNPPTINSAISTSKDCENTLNHE